MRIEAYNNLQQVYNTKRVSHVAEAAKVQKTDNLEISSIGRDILTAKNAVKESADIRADVVAPIKREIEKGTYDVSADDFADKLLASWNPAN